MNNPENIMKHLWNRYRSALIATFEIVYFAEKILIVLKREADSGAMPVLDITRKIFGLRL